MKKRNRQKINLLIVSLILFSSINFAQSNYHFKRFTDSEKLSNVLVHDFYQDSYGFMWFATSDGINRYDGKNVKVYKNLPGNNLSLPDNLCFQITEDLQKNLWIACYNAIGKLNRKTDKFNRYSLEDIPFKSAPDFLASLMDNKGGIWFTTNKLGVIRYNKTKDNFENIKLSKDNENNVWGEVHSIVQLKNGVIIVADFSNGLKKYDTETNMFVPYNLKPNLSPKRITVIHESKTGNIWFGGDDIIIKYSPTQFIYNEYKNIKRFSKLKSHYSQILGIEEDNNNLWISQANHGILRANKKFTIVEQFLFDGAKFGGLIGNQLNNLYLDKYGIIWASSIDGGILQLDLNSNSFDFSPFNINNISFNNRTSVIQINGSPLNNSNLIVSTKTEGMITFNSKSGKFSEFNQNRYFSRKDSNILIQAFDVDEVGNIWYAGTNYKLDKLDHTTNKITSYNPAYYNYTSDKYLIKSIRIKHSGEIWIASNIGVDRFNPSTGEFNPVPRIMNKKVNQKLRTFATNIVESREPLSSILKVGEGVNREDSFSLDKKQKVLLICVGEGLAQTYSMFDYGTLSIADGKNIWAFDDLDKTFYSGGGFKNRISFKCLELDKGNYKLHYQSDVGHAYGNFNTAATPDSNWWGIQAFKISDEEFKNIKTLNEQEIAKPGYLPFELAKVIEFSRKYSNIIWIGTFTNSFFRYNISNGKYKQYNFNINNISDAVHNIRTIYEDSEGILWVGTYSSLIRLNPETDQLNVFTPLDGIPGGIIESIVEDNFGALWIHSSGGLSKLNKNAPINKFVFVNYDSKDGLGELEFNSSMWKDENGKIYYGGKGGIISFSPGKVNSFKPDIVISDFKIDDISMFDDSSQVNLEQTIFDTPQINLSYSENNISFDFASIHFSRPAKNKIAYMLDGFNNKWYETDRNYVSFTNLDPGEYTFIVKGSNGDGIWNEKGRHIKINISPPWWQTTFAYINYGLFLVVFIFGVDRFQRKRLLSKAKERMKIQDAEHRAEAAELQSRAIQAENERKTKELEEARQLQLSMLPKELPELPNLDIAVYMKTATEVGGDYYDFHIGMDGTLTVVVGDATGHGMKAGTMVTAAKSLFNVLAPNSNIVETFHEMTRCLKLMHMNKLSMCMTMLKIIGDKIQMSAAGMPPVFIYKRDSQTIEEHVIKGMPLGTFSNFPYSLVESTISSGDTILMMSDGFPELFNDKKEMFGYKRTRNLFEDLAEEAPEEIISKLKTAGSEWVKDQDPDDDVTFVVIKVK